MKMAGMTGSKPILFGCSVQVSKLDQRPETTLFCD